LIATAHTARGRDEIHLEETCMRDSNRIESTSPHAGDLPIPRQPPTAGVINDGVMTAKLRGMLAADPVTRAYLVQIEFFHGTLLLSGYVEFEKVRLRVTQLAMAIVGITEVKNLLEIREVLP
jgi:osmotically-inducible protein OsmY